VGSRGLGGVKRILMGSVSEGIVHHARRPVLVMRGREDAWPPARVVVADDSSEDAKKAGELAVNIGKLFGARTLLVRVLPERLEGAQEDGPPGSQGVDELLRQAEMDLEARADGLEGVLGSQPQTEIRMAEGDPAVAIPEAAQEGDEPTLIAVGSRGLGMIQRVRLGSVSTKIIRAAPGPVLVYPHR
jgi:nucleotide-binding universal stress UspA family protein